MQVDRIRNEYSKYQEEFIKMLTPLQSMCDGHLSWILPIKHRANLEWATILPTHLEPYHAEPKARDFESSNIENVLGMNVIETA